MQEVPHEVRQLSGCCPEFRIPFTVEHPFRSVFPGLSIGLSYLQGVTAHPSWHHPHGTNSHLQPEPVGALLGSDDGALLGDADTLGMLLGDVDGAAEGSDVGCSVGALLGLLLGSAVGALLGSALGSEVGADVTRPVGAALGSVCGGIQMMWHAPRTTTSHGVGCALGALLGSIDGKLFTGAGSHRALGCALGDALDDTLGDALGEADGVAVGAPLGDEDELGWDVGVPLGAGLGWVPGAQVVTHGS